VRFKTDNKTNIEGENKMKVNKKVVGIALLSGILLNSGIALAAPGAVEGAPAKRNTDAVVSFKESVDPITPVDPIDPDNPVEPGTNGPLSLDYASAFNFGEQVITPEDKVYEAATQEVIIEGEHSQKPLYAQVTDGRGSEVEEGWSLSVKQNGQFVTDKGKELNGAVIKFATGQTATVSESKSPSIVTEDVELVADGSASSLLMQANVGEGAGTHIYRLGDLDTMTSGVQLHVPGKTTKVKDSYSTSLTWELSTLPDNK
jgi:hypothetical protein